MKIVIDISKEDYKRIKNEVQKFGGSYRDWEEEIANGTPLPEHHGRIIDESQIRHIVWLSERELYGDKIRYVKETDAPTIIEADKENKE